MKKNWIYILDKDGNRFDKTLFPDPDDERLDDGAHYDPDDVNRYWSQMVKHNIDLQLVAKSIDIREQIVTTANGLQVALIGLSSLIKACSESSDPVLKQTAEPLLPFADSFLKARESGNMPVDVLGIESVAQKVIHTSIVSGQVVKDVMSQG